MKGTKGMGGMKGSEIRKDEGFKGGREKAL